MKNAVLGGILALAAIGVQAQNSLNLINSPGAFVGGRQVVSATPQNGYTIEAFIDSQANIRFNAIGVNSIYGKNGNSFAPGYDASLAGPSDFWLFAMHAPFGELPTTGRYIIPSGDNQWALPIFDITANFTTAPKFSGEFDILKLELTEDREIAALRVYFNVFESDNPQRQNTGYLEYTRTSVVPEPTTFSFMALGLLLLLGTSCSRTRAAGELS